MIVHRLQSTIHSLQMLHPTASRKHSSVSQAIAGGMAGVTAATMLQPLDVVKTRLQQSAHQKHKLYGGVKLPHGSSVGGAVAAAADAQSGLALQGGPRTIKTILSSPKAMAGGNQCSITQGKSIINLPRALSVICREEGFAALWHGWSASCVRVAFGGATYFMLLNKFSVLFEKNFPQPKGGDESSVTNCAMNNFLIGACARGTAVIIENPVTIVKARMEAAGSRSHKANARLHTALWQVIAKEGVGGVYRGVWPSLLRDMPYAGFYLATYNGCRSCFGTVDKEHPVVSSFVSGVVAGAVATICTHPPDVVKTRVQLQTGTVTQPGNTSSVGMGNAVRQSSAREIAKQIITEEGVVGLFSGLGPRILKRSLTSGIAWTIYATILREIDATIGVSADAEETKADQRTDKGSAK